MVCYRVGHAARASQPTTHAEVPTLNRASKVDTPGPRSSPSYGHVKGTHRMVICLTMSPPLPVMPPSLELTEAVPGFFSKTFQNFRLSSAA